MPMSVKINPVTRQSRDAKKKGAGEDLVIYQLGIQKSFV